MKSADLCKHKDRSDLSMLHHQVGLRHSFHLFSLTFQINHNIWHNKNCEYSQLSNQAPNFFLPVHLFIPFSLYGILHLKKLQAFSSSYALQLQKMPGSEIYYRLNTRQFNNFKYISSHWVDKKKKARDKRNLKRNLHHRHLGSSVWSAQVTIPGLGPTTEWGSMLSLRLSLLPSAPLPCLHSRSFSQIKK